MSIAESAQFSVPNVYSNSIAFNNDILRDKYRNRLTFGYENKVLSKLIKDKDNINKYIADQSWNVNKNNIKERDFNQSHARSSLAFSDHDDGVALLVGIFNLLAIVVYTFSKHISSEGITRETIIHVDQQIQSVLDDLVLRVHSSNPTANLLSRSVKSTSQSSRKYQSLSAIDTVILYMKYEKVNKLKNILKILKSSVLDRVEGYQSSIIATEIYRPLKSIINNLRKGKQNRAFSGQSLKQLGYIFESMLSLDVKDYHNIFRSLNQLKTKASSTGGQTLQTSIFEFLYKWIKSQDKRIIRNRRNAVVSWLKPVNNLKTVSLYDRLKNKIKSYVKKERRYVNQLSKHPKYNNKINEKYLKKPVKHFKETRRSYHVPSEHSSTVVKHYSSKLKNKYEKQKKVEKYRKMEQNGDEKLMDSYWADNWFSLILVASPVAFDITTIYTKSRYRPKCLRYLLCHTNSDWRKKGPIESSLTPLLSVLTSWALETAVDNTLGDSLIAIRAGWMLKNCAKIYPECLDSIHDKANVDREENDGITEYNDTYKLQSRESDNEGEIVISIPREPIKEETAVSQAQNTIQHMDGSIYPEPRTSNKDNSIDSDYSLVLFEKYDIPPSKANSAVISSHHVTGLDLQDRPIENYSPVIESEEPIDRADNFESNSYFDYDGLYSPTSYEYFDNEIQDEDYADYNTEKNTFEMEGIKEKPLAWSTQLEPAYLSHNHYATYMGKQSKSPNKNINTIEQNLDFSSIKSKYAGIKIPEKTHNTLKSRQKESFGLRRGLPSKRVSGFTSLVYSATRRQGIPEIDDRITRYQKDAHSEALLNKAAKEVFRNKLLYEYIKDRQMRMFNYIH